VLNITANTTFYRGVELQGSGLSKKSLSEKKCEKRTGVNGLLKLNLYHERYQMLQYIGIK